MVMTLKKPAQKKVQTPGASTRRSVPVGSGRSEPPPGQIRMYSYDLEEYVEDDKGNEVMTEMLWGEALRKEVTHTYKQYNSRSLDLWMQERGVHLKDVFAAQRIDFDNLGDTQVRAILENDMLEPFFGTATEDGIRLGIESIIGEWEDLIAQTINLDGQAIKNYRLTGATDSDDYTLKGVGQAAEIPTATITIGTSQVQLSKKARGIEWSYESLDAPIALAQIWLRVLGVRIGESYANIIAQVLLDGTADDGSDDPEEMLTEVDGVIGIKDLLKARKLLQRDHGFPLTDIVLNPDTNIELSIMQWPVSGAPIFPNGIEAVLGAVPHENESIPEAEIVFMNRDSCLIRYVNRPFSTETEQDKSKQVWGTFASVIDAIVIAVPESRIVLNADHTA